MNSRTISVKISLGWVKIRKCGDLNLKLADQGEEFFLLAGSQRNVLLVFHYNRVTSIGFDEVIEVAHID